jgi:ribose transport system permease protein
MNWFLEQRFASVLIALFVLGIGLSIASEFFLLPRNLMNVGRQISVVAIVALGQTLVIMSGGIDLSVGSNIGLSAVCAALTLQGTGSPELAIVAALVCGMLVGLTNGILVAFVKINPFIATLGMLSVARGMALLLTGGLPYEFQSWASFLGYGRVFGVSASLLVLLVVLIAIFVFATRTRLGRNILAVGDNPRAARLAGINVNLVTIIVYTICGLTCGIGGLLLAGTLRSANPNLGMGYELDVIAAVILGGTALTGGRGSIIGAVIGAALMGVLRNGFVLLDISAYWQVVAIGVVVLLAVGLDSLRRSRS